MIPVTVPRDLLLPRTEGWEDKSAATADVIILFGLKIAMERFIFKKEKFIDEIRTFFS
jgi:hypothetical protein